MAQFANAPNILLNSALPFDPRDGGTRLLGTAEYIAWEVLIAIVFRRDGWTESYDDVVC